DLPLVPLLVARAYSAIGDPAEARATLEEGLARHPRANPVVDACISIRAEQGAYREAAALLERASLLDGGTHRARIAAGRTQAVVEELTPAMEAYHYALALSPHAGQRGELSWLLLKECDDVEDSFRLVTRARLAAATIGPTLDALGIGVEV